MPSQTHRAKSVKGVKHYRQSTKRHDVQKFAKTGKGLIVCKTCRIYFVEKHWMHPAEAKDLGEDKSLRFTICPACRMKADHTFEGELILRNFPIGRKRNILETIQNSGNQAYEQDPLKRILNIEASDNEIHVYTSKNQLAVRLGREIARAFKGKLEIHWSKGEDPVRVLWSGGMT